MARADISTDSTRGGSQTALLPVQPTIRVPGQDRRPSRSLNWLQGQELAGSDQGEEPANPPQGFTIFDAMLLGMVIVWAANPAAIKWALDYIDPLTFNALRFALATLLPLGLMLLSKESFRWQRGDGWKLAMLGVAGHGIYQAIFILAINNTLAGNVALILSVNPAFVVVFGVLLGIERARGHTWAGIGITLAGVLLVVLGSGKQIEFG